MLTIATATLLLTNINLVQSQQVNWKAWGGFLPAGNDINTTTSGITIAEAEDWCYTNKECAGFTFNGPREGPVPVGETLYYKNKTAVDEFVYNSTSSWTTYLVSQGPCDILKNAGTPCVAAFSVTRALYSSYIVGNPLYEINRTSDSSKLNVTVIPNSGGIIDTSPLDFFCEDNSCVILRLFDQSGFGNHLEIAPPNPHRGPGQPSDTPVNLTQSKISIGGLSAYAAVFEGGMGYRNVNTTGIATGNDPETIYYVIDGQHYNDGCCFDFGNAELTPGDDGDGTMESVYWGSSSGWSHGFSNGPWVGSDLENGIWFGNETSNPSNVPLHYPFVVAMLKGGTDGFALKAADATQGKFMTMFDGPRPLPSYQPMKKQGGLILGIGGDNTKVGIGTFYEGIVTSGYTTNDVDDAIQRNIVNAGYGL
jgi:non-reducing end alpha-L-arabinofuranosidase